MFNSLSVGIFENSPKTYYIFLKKSTKEKKSKLRSCFTPVPNFDKNIDSIWEIQKNEICGEWAQEDKNALLTLLQPKFHFFISQMALICLTKFGMDVKQNLNYSSDFL